MDQCDGDRESRLGDGIHDGRPAVEKKGIVFHFEEVFIYMADTLGSPSKQLVMRRDGARREGAFRTRYRERLGSH
ncbi:hypothetical protein MHYP_G00214430 [Metynnis hypsauchen]